MRIKIEANKTLEEVFEESNVLACTKAQAIYERMTDRQKELAEKFFDTDEVLSDEDIEEWFESGDIFQEIKELENDRSETCFPYEYSYKGAMNA